MPPLLQVRNLTTHFQVRNGWVRAVDEVSLDVERGETLGLVGESGCGKTTLGYSIIQLLPKNAFVKGGKVVYNGKDLIKITRKKDGRLEEYHPEIRKVRWKEIAMIFQGAMNAFNPVVKVGDQIIEAIRVHEKITEEEAIERVRELFRLVGIPRDRIFDYPHEYSGGMRQRAVIAMALALNPKLVIADEPTTALDVIMQDKILGEIARIQRELKTAMIIVTHDVSVVAEVANRIAVMYAGQVVERAASVDIFANTGHPYTEGLLGAFPAITGEKRRLISISGNPPSLLNPPTGCRFHPRCKYAKDICRIEDPPLIKLGEGHVSRCHFAADLFGSLGSREAPAEVNS